MQKDMKIGIAIGVLLLSLIAIFWWAQEEKKTPRIPPADLEETGRPLTDVLGPPAGGSDVALPWSEGAETATPPAAPAGQPPAPTKEVEAPAAATAPTQVYTHIVKRGDTLTSIAKAYYGDGRKWKKIMEANRNRISDPGSISIGLKLTIPKLATAPTQRTLLPATLRTTGSAGRHTVKAGDTLAAIAKRYYGSEGKWRRILAANRDRIGSDARRLKIGVVLIIPPDEE